MMHLLAQLQPEQAQPMADALRADGKIWVVVATIMLVLSGFFYLLFLLDARVKKLEKEQNS
jgi:hypothetical protein